METGTVETDMGIGVAVVFALLTLGSAVVLLFATTQIVKAWGFAAAMVAASLAIWAIHVYE